MTKLGNELLIQLTAATETGPFVTIMFNTHVAHQDIEQDQLMLKNFSKEAKKRFNKKYPEENWQPYQTRIDQLLTDQSFWRSATASVALILTPEKLYRQRLAIHVDDQYYVGDEPYLLAISKNQQFQYEYVLMTLTRDSFALYKGETNQLTKLTLAEDAPITLKKALGEEVTALHNLGRGNGEIGTIHGTSTKDEEEAIDHRNYYQAIVHFLQTDWQNLADLPLYIMALPENLTVFDKVAKNLVYDRSIRLPQSPSQLSIKELEVATKKLTTQLREQEEAAYQRLADRKHFTQFADIKQAATAGRIAELFIATENLAEGFGETPETEYDWRQELNHVAGEVLRAKGNVRLMARAAIPTQQKLAAILRY